MNATKQATDIVLTSKIASAVSLFRSEFPDAKVDEVVMIWNEPVAFIDKFVQVTEELVVEDEAATVPYNPVTITEVAELINDKIKIELDPGIKAFPELSVNMPVTVNLSVDQTGYIINTVGDIEIAITLALTVKLKVFVTVPSFVDNFKDSDPLLSKNNPVKLTIDDLLDKNIHIVIASENTPQAKWSSR